MNKKGNNPLFDDYVSVVNYTGKTLTSHYGNLPFVSPGRFTYAFLARDCATGSGSIANLRFRAIDTAEDGTEIEIEEDFGGQEVLILDCISDEFTNAGVPQTRHAATVAIN